MGCIPGLDAVPLQPVDEDEQAKPHDINEVPVPGGRFEGEVAVWGEMPGNAAKQHDGQDQGPNRDMQAVKTGQHEES